jgi:hypothetical protein
MTVEIPNELVGIIASGIVGLQGWQIQRLFSLDKKLAVLSQSVSALNRHLKLNEISPN